MQSNLRVKLLQIPSCLHVRWEYIALFFTGLVPDPSYLLPKILNVCFQIILRQTVRPAILFGRITTPLCEEKKNEFSLIQT